MPKAKTTGTTLESVATAVAGKADPHLPVGAKRTKRNSALATTNGKSRFVTTYKPLTGAAIVEGVRKGMPVTFAASRVRVPQPTCSGWLSRGETDLEAGLDTDLAVFALDVRQAQAEFVEKCIDGVVDAGLSDAKQWTALMTALERLHPEYFARKDNKTTQNINIAVGIVEKKLHELHAAGEIEYSGG